MQHAGRTLQRSWTLSGRYFGHWDGDDLWSFHGQHVGRLRGCEIFAPDGRYIGEMLGNGRLAVRSRKIGTYGTAYIPWPPKFGDAFLPSLDPGTQRIGYEDFPPPSEFRFPATSVMGFPASIPC